MCLEKFVFCSYLLCLFQWLNSDVNFQFTTVCEAKLMLLICCLMGFFRCNYFIVSASDFMLLFFYDIFQIPFHMYMIESCINTT